MKIEIFLAQKKGTILKKWFHLILKTYPDETLKFLEREKDPFDNPVGSIISKGIEELFEELIKGTAIGNVSPFLDRIIRVRALQDFTPSRAIAFVFLLKKVIRDELGDKIRDKEFQDELLRFETKVDELALLCFDLYMECREKIYGLRADEVKRKYSNILKRLDFISDVPEQEPGCH